MKSGELAFFGKIAAGVTHEIKNVLAIINESNGLMEDLLAMAKDSPFPGCERFQRSIGRIEEQVRRGMDITSRFNHFSHSMDREVAEVDLNEMVCRTVALMQRFARLNNLELRVIPAAEAMPLVANSFRLQMALAKAIEACMGAMKGKGSINLHVRGEQEFPCLELECEVEEGGTADLVEAAAGAPAWNEFRETAAVVGLEVSQVLRTGFTLLFQMRALHRSDSNLVS